MIKNNLSILLSERSMSNTTLSERTGISKNTISSISQNDIKMIQLETINKICQALNVTPNEFFMYLPFDYRIETYFDIEDYNSTDNFTKDGVDFRIIQTLGTTIETYAYYVYFRQIPLDTDWYDDRYDLFVQASSTQYGLHEKLQEKFLDQLNITFKSDFTNYLEKELANCIKYLVKKEEFDFGKKELLVKIDMEFFNGDITVKL
ncbi:helix-turn-helix domain-containing protein [Vagococcus fluvialis]|jgi:DNA-binding Xre family transcriptional regulator|uniref:helix-turn-helix domain-containing protein n=1 Tax=Vagococcus fluvialis TaxID=2738 RepID=UPI002839E3C5|nr:helix-turn-helix transcriptional regulator [Vagococcus sp.]